MSSYSAQRSHSLYVPVHPRVGGEHTGEVYYTIRLDGSSPRGRGTLLLGTSRLRLGRFIPAWAGNTGGDQFDELIHAVHPRVGGEHWRRGDCAGLARGSSPRGRGTRQILPCLGFIQRFIPAWAGNTTGFGRILIMPAVHPRVGGEHRAWRLSTSSASGSSPRGRGTPHFKDLIGVLFRFIPAWAGNTWLGSQNGRQRPVHPRVGGEHKRRGTPFW